MGKHDKVIATSSAEFYQAEAERQRKRAEFAEETCRQLREQIGRTNKWMNEVEAAAQDKIAEKDAKIAMLQLKILNLVNDYV